MSDFVPNKLVPIEMPYKCSNDCVPQGCPGHTAKFMYQSTADIFLLEFKDREPIYLDMAEMECLVAWIEALEK